MASASADGIAEHDSGRRRIQIIDRFVPAQFGRRRGCGKQSRRFDRASRHVERIGRHDFRFNKQRFSRAARRPRHLPRHAASPPNRTATAQVDNGPSTVNFVVAQAATTTTITSDNPDPSLVGQTITVNYTVTVNAPGMGTPTGNVTVSDGVNSCMGTVAAGSCNVALTTLGARTLTATYAGDANFTTSSDTEPHTVNKANTTTTITAESADPTAQGEVFTVFYAIAVVAPGAGTPSGTVTVTDGINSCMGTVAAGQCSLFLNTAGMRTLTATYAGNANYNGSVSAGEPHTVLPITAAPVELSGRVMSGTGRGISGAQVTIRDAAGNSRLARTGAFGYFRFAEMRAGETYIIAVKARRYRFAEQAISLTGDLTGLIFIAQE